MVEYPNMWHVQYKDDFSAVRIRDPSNKAWSEYMSLFGTMIGGSVISQIGSTPTKISNNNSAEY